MVLTPPPDSDEILKRAMLLGPFLAVVRTYIPHDMSYLCNKLPSLGILVLLYVKGWTRSTDVINGQILVICIVPLIA